MAATIAPAPKRHQRNPLITLAAAALKADLAPRHYRIPPPGDMPRKTPSAASGSRKGSDGALRLRPPARRTPPRRGSSSRRRGSPQCRGRPGSPPAGRSGRSRRPAAAPAPRCRDYPPAPPRCGRGSLALGIDLRAKSPTRSTNVSRPNTSRGRCRSPQASGPLPARCGAQPHPVLGQRQQRLGGSGGDRGRDDDPV